MTGSPDLDCVVVGAGVVGIAIARALQLAGRSTFLLEANERFGMETSSRNSEVIHAGIYYPPGSMKAELCVDGRGRLYDYCATRNVPHKQIGKIIVATTDGEVATLHAYKATAERNGVTDLEWLDANRIAALEPDIVAVKGLHSPSTGIIDSHAYMQALLDDFELAGGHFVRGNAIVGGLIEANGIEIIDQPGNRLSVGALVNSCGLSAPDFAALLVGFPADKLPCCHYAIGHYFLLSGKAPFKRLVYPVAVAGGLGVHVTLDMTGIARFGPDVDWIDSIDYRFDASRKQRFVDAIRRYYPALDEAALVPGYTGIRPKISGPQEPAADFCIQGPADHGVAGLVNLFGIESPGLTSSLAIADRVATLLSATAPSQISMDRI